MKSIKAKVTAVICILVFLISVGLGVVSYLGGKRALDANLKKTMTKISEISARDIQKTVELDFLNLEGMSYSKAVKTPEEQANPEIDSATGASKFIQETASTLRDEAGRNGFTKVGLADKNGMLVYSNGEVLDIKDAEYYKSASQGTRYISSPIISEDKKSSKIIYSVPVKKSEKIVGVAIAEKDGLSLSSLTDTITIGNTGRAFILDKQGTTIAHSSRELVSSGNNDIANVKTDSSLQGLVDIENKMISGMSGIGEYTYKGVNKFVAYAPISGLNWSLAVAMNKEEVYSENQQLIITTIVVALIFIGIGIVTALIFGQSLGRKIRATSMHLNVLAEGDLTMNLPEKSLKDKDELGEMARAMKNMQTSLKSMVQNIIDKTRSIDEQAYSLSGVAEEMSSSAQNVSSSIQEVANGSGGQTQELIDIASILQKFGSDLDSIVGSVNEVENNSISIGDMAAVSNENMKRLSESVSKVSAAFDTFRDRINNFGNHISEINKITSLINDIAEQTNLLALNAAIEAARAGESGRGFSVVADEIRKLAEQSMQSSSNISKLIVNVSEDSGRMVKSSYEVNEELENQVGIINTSILSFKQILEEVQTITPMMKEISNSTNNISRDKDVILEKIEETSSISQEVSASSEEIAASSERMSESTQTVASSSNALSHMTKEVMEEMTKFKL
jgi:methyl-accepting chemotaxis protein